jgi:hypothetical protein
LLLHFAYTEAVKDIKMSTALRFSELSEIVNELSSQLLKAASNASEAISLRERALASAEERVSDLTIALQKADSVIIELSSRVVSLQHERQNFAARAAKLRVEFEREMRAVELDAASYARCVTLHANGNGRTLKILSRR